MTTNSQPTSYNDIKRLAGEALAQAVTEAKNAPTLNQRLTTLETAYDTSTEATAGRLKEHTEELKTHTETLKEANRRANWQDQRIDDLLTPQPHNTPTRKDINTNLADQARYVTSHVHTLCEGIIANPAADENTVKHALDLERLARYLEWKTENLTKEGTEQC